MIWIPELLDMLGYVPTAMMIANGSIVAVQIALEWGDFPELARQNQFNYNVLLTRKS